MEVKNTYSVKRHSPRVGDDHSGEGSADVVQIGCNGFLRYSVGEVQENSWVTPEL